jgi:hypothetical protein
MSSLASTLLKVATPGTKLNPEVELLLEILPVSGNGVTE